MKDVYGMVISKGISPDYFLDVMSDREVEAMLNEYYNQLKREAENTRLIMYSSLAPYSKNLKLTDVLKFSWDNETTSYVPTPLEKEAVKKQANELFKKIQVMRDNEQQ